MTEVLQKDLIEAREVCPTTTQRLVKEGALLLDVREPHEVAALAFSGCEVMTIPLSEFEDRWAEVPRDRDVILACAGGVRSLKATYFLMYQGYDLVANMSHGMTRWVARGFPVIGSVDGLAASAGASSCCGSAAEPAPTANACCGGQAKASSCC